MDTESHRVCQMWLWQVEAACHRGAVAGLRHVGCPTGQTWRTAVRWSFKKGGTEEKLIWLSQWTGRGILTGRKSQKDMIYWLFKGACDIFYEQSMLLTWLFSGTPKAISENHSNTCLYPSGGEVPTVPNALPFCCCQHCQPVWTFQEEEGKEGKKNGNLQTMYCTNPRLY